VLSLLSSAALSLLVCAESGAAPAPVPASAKRDPVRFVCLPLPSPQWTPFNPEHIRWHVPLSLAPICWKAAAPASAAATWQPNT